MPGSLWHGVYKPCLQVLLRHSPLSSLTSPGRERVGTLLAAASVFQSQDPVPDTYDQSDCPADFGACFAFGFCC